MADSMTWALAAVAARAKDEPITIKRRVLMGKIGIKSAPYRCILQTAQAVFLRKSSYLPEPRLEQALLLGYRRQRTEFFHQFVELGDVIIDVFVSILRIEI